jgi:hypothetical protein
MVALTGDDAHRFEQRELRVDEGVGTFFNSRRQARSQQRSNTG